MKKYRIYIDEVGNNDLGSSENPNHRYLSLTGIIFELDYVKNEVNPKLESIKNKYFDYHPDEPIVFHRKELVNRKYQTWKYDPYHYCMEILVERFTFFLNGKNSLGDVMIESRGGKEDRRLKKSFRKIYESGTNFLDYNKIQKNLTSCELKVKPKYLNISGLQIADLIAHPSRRYMFRKYKIDEGKKFVFGDEIIKIIERKYYRGNNDAIEGYGMKFLP